MKAPSTGQIYRDFFASFSEISPDLFYVKDKERRLVYADQTYQDIFDIDRDSLRGKRIEDLWPDQAEAVIPDEKRALAGKRITDVERAITHPDGSEHWYSVNKIPQYDAENNIIGFLGFDRDITQRKERERELDRTRSQFRALTENSQLGVLSVNDEGIIQYANDGIESILGHESTDLIEEPLTRLIPNRLRGGHESGFLRYLRTGTRELDWDWVQVPGLASNGDEIPLGISFGETIVNGKHRFTAVIRDISRQKERKAELQTLRRAVEEAGQAIFITDDDGKIEYVNPAFERITGYSRDEAVGQNPRILQSGELDEEYYERMWEEILDGKLWQEEIPNRRQSGELYYAHQTIAPITQNGDLTKFVAIQHEITERKEREQHLEIFNRVLRHNHRNLLNMIRGMASSLPTSSEDERSKLVGMIQETSTDLHDLSEKAYTLTQLLMGDQRRVSISNLSNEVDSVVTEFENRNPEADISLNAGPDLSISAHPHFRRAIRELVENAIKHTDSEKVSVRLDVERTERGVAVSISDNGPGIPAHEYEVITNDRNLTQIDHGSGLGLWLAYWIVRRSGGNMRFDVGPEGSTVEIELPHGSVENHQRPVKAGGSNQAAQKEISEQGEGS